jgi:segregation and condensation protein B
MSATEPTNSNQPPDDLPLGESEEQSLEMLGRVYSRAMGRREKEIAGATKARQPTNEVGDDPEPSTAVADDPSDDQCPVDPRTILESLLFVGLTDSAISSRQAASLIRGVSPKEIEALVDELNASYETDRSIFRIHKDSDGFRLVIDDEFHPIRERMVGRNREARLGGAAIEVLAVVAYHQPVTIEEIDRLRNRQSAPVLNLLVRRELLTVERDEKNRRVRRFRTGARFLELFGLETIEDLPQAHTAQGADFLDE